MKYGFGQPGPDIQYEVKDMKKSDESQIRPIFIHIARRHAPYGKLRKPLLLFHVLVLYLEALVIDVHGPAAHTHAGETAVVDQILHGHLTGKVGEPAVVGVGD